MTLIQLGRTTPLLSATIPYDYPFVRKIALGNYIVDRELLAIFPNLEEQRNRTIDVIGLRDRSSQTYDKKASINDVIGEPVTWFFDKTEQLLYVHMKRTDSPIAIMFLYGQTQGFSEGKLVYVDDLVYEPVITSSIGLGQQEDLAESGKLSFITGSIELSNAGGRLDDLISLPVYGNDVLIYNAETNIDGDTINSDGVIQLATLFVEDNDVGVNNISLRVQDKRKGQDIQLPEKRFDSSEYPNIENELMGAVIPIMWGTAKEIPCIVTNGNLDSGAVNYRAAILLTELGTVNVETDSGWVAVTPTVTNLDTGEFTIAEEDGRDSNGNALDAKIIGATGIEITFISDIIKDINFRYGNYSESASNYDLDEWAVEETALSNGALYIDDATTLFNIIHILQQGANVGFRYEITADGRRTIRIDNENRDSVAHIDSVVIENRNKLTVKNSSKLLAGEYIAKYNHSYVTGKNLRVIDSSERSGMLEIYGQAPRREFPKKTPPIITAKIAAEEKIEWARNRFSKIRGVVKCRILCAGESRRELLKLRIYDIITIEITPSGLVDVDAATIEGRSFYGIKKCKILSINPDARSAVNEIEAVIIGDA